MQKEFNTTGTCYPHLHYMMDNSKKFEAVMALIKSGKYFTMHHPRQYGKTTILQALVNALRSSEDFFPIRLNFQGIDRKFYEFDLAFGEMFVEEVGKSLKRRSPTISNYIEKQKALRNIGDLTKLITGLVEQLPQKVVLFIDEVDASSQYAAFVNFLGLLRRMFLEHMEDPTFHSVVLVGVHDIKNLKFKLRNPEEAKYNSPWNIAVDFEIDLSFQPNEIVPMLEEYSKTEGITIDITVIAERLYYHTFQKWTCYGK